MDRTYIAIDMKSFYASVECVQRNLDPLQTKLLVADPGRSDQTICLAVSPALKAIGVPSRPRLFEAKQAIRKHEALTKKKVYYHIAMPRMAEYERISSLSYSIYLRYVAPEDIHVYSIDECFIDCTPYLHHYETQAEGEHQNPAHVMAMTMIRDVLKETGITATVGIGTNLYLAKVAMDIVAKKSPADKDGVRIAELSETSYRLLLWDHKPLTDFWHIGPGKAKRLAKGQMYTWAQVATRSQYDEEWFYKTFGIDAEILLDHAWGLEPVTMADIKGYHSSSHSLSNGQVLPRPYLYDEARLVFMEMIDILCSEMFCKNITSRGATWWCSYDWKSLEKCPEYEGPIAIDFYGRLHPAHTGGTVRLPLRTNSVALIRESLLYQFDARIDRRLLIRRLGVCANDTSLDDGIYQLDFFTDYEALAREKKIQGAMLDVRKRYGKSAIVKGFNLLEGATTIERNKQIGGHRA